MHSSGTMLCLEKQTVQLINHFCWKTHVVDYRITTQLITNKTATRQWTCANNSANVGVSNALGWGGGWRLLICLFQYLCVSDLWAVIKHVISEFIYCLTANFIVSLNRLLLKLSNIMQAFITLSHLMKWRNMNPTIIYGR